MSRSPKNLSKKRSLFERGFPPFMGLLLHVQKWDDMDQSAWERIEEQEGARVQNWHTKQGVSGKKIPTR